MNSNLLHTQSGRCYWCCVPLDFTQVEIDHLIPRSKGGSDDDNNLRAACRRCNNLKGMTLAMDFALFQLRAPLFIRTTIHGQRISTINPRHYVSNARAIWLKTAHAIESRKHNKITKNNGLGRLK
jgi:hypothetical protein